jgi:hypothetical protein
VTRLGKRGPGTATSGSRNPGAPHPPPRAPRPRGHISSRQAIRRVRDAFAERKDGGLQAAYADARSRTRGLRVVLALADRVLPITKIIQFAGEVSQGIREDGLANACAAGVRRLGLDCEFVMSEATRQVLATSPVIMYGNHPTVLTPFLVAAAVRRADVRLFMHGYACRLIPSLGEYVLPLNPPVERDWVEWRRGGLARVVARRLARVAERSRNRGEAKRANRQALAAGVRHVEQGGCVVIFPGGGGRRELAWYPGIGHVAREVRRTPDASDVFLLPVHEEAVSEAQVRRGLRRLGASERLVGASSQVRMRFSEPRRLSELVDAAESPETIALCLQRDYEKNFPPSCSSWLARILLGGRHAWGRNRV